MPALYMAMIETAEIVADTLQISREAQDEYALQSQRRTAEGQAAGRFNAEIVPLPSTMVFRTRTAQPSLSATSTLAKDEGNRPDTTLQGLSGLKPVFQNGQRMKEGKFITAGNASQLSDGASAAVLMEEKEAERRGASRSAAISAWSRRAASPTRWVSALCSRCRSCCRSTASRWTISVCGN